eukprot:TRINITY_DN1898_c0_g1_i3.p1 TRINITY_DN1898_c0_g1~~TRINITY_DN1898_c0_g1_i3.p1  ORF type:complete len:822 (+),score=149.67 TRINITY_DN1898_c0_g1_i3:351-2816(+)
MTKVTRDVKMGEFGKNGSDMASALEGKALFPRLHVKETKAAGPRAPPRNKMALYEQFSIPSHRFVPSPAEQSPTALLNQPASCDTRLVYTPYYVPPSSYSPVNFSGQFIGHNVLSWSNNSVRASDKPNLDAARGRTSSGTVSHSHSKVPKAQGTESSLLSTGAEAKDTTHQDSSAPTSCNLAYKDAARSSYFSKNLETTRSASRKTVVKDSKTALPKRNSSGEQNGSCIVVNDEIEQGEKRREFIMNACNTINGDGYCVGGLPFDKTSNEEIAEESRVDCEDNYPSKNSSTSESITDSKGHEHCSSIPTTENVGHTNKTNGSQKLGSTCADSHYKVEKHLKDIEKVSNGCQWKDATVNEQQKSASCGELQTRTHTTPLAIWKAIGQKEFWRVRTTILRQQKIFLTQVFELHRLMEVQKLIAISPNILVEHDTYENMPTCTTEEQRVPETENFPRKSSVNVSHDSNCALTKCKLVKDSTVDSSAPYDQVARNSSQQMQGKDQSHAASFPVATFVPAPASTWGYPAFPQNPFAFPSQPGGYACYNPYTFNQFGGVGIVLGIPCSSEGAPMRPPPIHTYQNQSPCSEHQPCTIAHFMKVPFPNGVCSNNSMAPALCAPEKVTHSLCEAGSRGSNAYQDEISAASNGYKSGSKPTKQVADISVENISTVPTFQDSISNVPSKPGSHIFVQSRKDTARSNHLNSVLTRSLSEQDEDDNLEEQEGPAAKHGKFSTENFSGHDSREHNENSKEQNEYSQASVDLENHALSLFPMSSSASGSSEIPKDDFVWSDQQQRVRVIKAVPRAAVAASETTADILLSLQRERRR